MATLEQACKGKTLEEIWTSAEVKRATQKLRAELQEIANQWASNDHKRHIPVYISLKPKITRLGLYFEKRRGNGSIVLFPIRANGYPITSTHILSRAQMEETLKHEYAHHLTGTAHGKNFQDNLQKVSKRK